MQGPRATRRPNRQHRPHNTPEARRLAGLRGRGRVLDDAADRPHLVPPRPHSRRARAGPLPPTLIRRRPGLLQTRERSRLIYRPCPDARPDGRKSFSWQDYRDLIQTAHQQLGGPIVLVWDNLNTRLTAGMRRYIAERDWLTVYQLPPYAPDLNPVEGIWSVLRRITTTNRAFADPQDLITAVRRGLRQLQYRHDVLDGCLTGTGLAPASP